MSGGRLDDWLRVLDELTYYQVLGVDFSCDEDALQGAFHAFAAAFHPDAHAAAPPEDRRAAQVVFARGAEAYRVLSDERLRALYDEALSEGDVRPAAFTSMLPPPAAPREDELDEATLTAAARPFARRADELAREGDFAQAALYLDLALFHDPKSPSLAAYKAWLRKQR